MFEIDAYDLCWINGVPDDADDLCLHGHAVAKIGDEVLEYDAAVSATALHLLKSLTEDHIIGHGNQMLPCCGFFLFPNKALDTVEIDGCKNGIDWSVIHIQDKVKLITSTGKETVINMPDYRRQVYQFADKMEAFYKSCTEKILPPDEFSRSGYLAFWNEWKRRRGSTCEDASSSLK